MGLLQKTKILLIVEGAKTEPKLFKHFINLKSDISNISIVSVNTNIYSLYKRILKYDEEFFAGAADTIDVLREILKEDGRLSDAEKIKDKFGEIYLFFDFEYQDKNIPDDEKYSFLNGMQKYFSEETDHGLLLINYPMIEAYRDFNPAAPSNSYYCVDIDISDIKEKKYKEIVGKRGYDLDISSYNIDLFENVIIQNIEKANYIINNKYELPEYMEFLSYIYESILLKKEFDYIKQKNKISVVCTCIYILISYYGKEYYNKLKNRL